MVSWLSVLLLTLLQAAYAVDVHLAIDPSELSVGQAGSARVIVVGGQADSPPVIRDTGTVRFSYVGSSSRTQMTNQGISSYTQYNYQIIPLEVGQFEIGPVLVAVAGAR